MAHKTFVSITCETCEGSGRDTVARSRWVGGSNGYRSTSIDEVRCETCDGAGERLVSTFAPEARQLERAHREGLAIIATERPGTFMVSSGMSKFVFYRSTSTCKAGQHGRPCKHRALFREMVGSGKAVTA